MTPYGKKVFGRAALILLALAIVGFGSYKAITARIPDVVITWYATSAVTQGEIENVSGRDFEHVAIFADVSKGTSQSGFYTGEKRGQTNPFELSHLDDGQKAQITLWANYYGIDKLHVTETLPDGSTRELKVRIVVSPG